MEYLINVGLIVLFNLLPTAIIFGALFYVIYKLFFKRPAQQDDASTEDKKLAKTAKDVMIGIYVAGMTLMSFVQLTQPAITYKHTTGYDRTQDIRNIQRKNVVQDRAPVDVMVDLMSTEEQEKRNERLRDAQNYKQRRVTDQDSEGNR